MSAHIDCAIGERPHAPHRMAGGKPATEKSCEGTPAPYVCPVTCEYAVEVGVPGAATPPCPGGYCSHYAPEVTA